MKSPLGNEHWLQTMIRASGRMNISHMQDGAPMTRFLLSSNITEEVTVSNMNSGYRQ